MNRVGQAEPESIGPYRGYLRGVADCEVARSWLASLGEHLRSGAGMILADGRHRSVRLRMPQENGSCEVVVKAFGCGGGLERLRQRFRGTKAWRSWSAAVHLHGQGVGTPEPLAILEHRENGVLRESYYVSAYLPDTVSFGEALLGLYRSEPDGTKLMALLQAVADAIKAMHAAGFVHYDLGNQNILLRREGERAWRDVVFIDLNRGRLRERVSDREAGRDLSRISLPSDFLRVFVEMYAGGGIPSAGLLKWEAHYRQRYAWHARTRRWRHPLRARRQRALRKQGADTRREYPGPRSVWIWDPLSRQPLITMRRKERKRYFGWRRHWQALVSPLRLLPACHRHYRDFREGAYQKPVSFAGRVGVAVEWREGDDGRSQAALVGLGSIPVLVRFYRHETDAHREGTVAFVKQLHAAGHPVSIALLQDRAAVEQPELWRGFVDAVLSAVGSMVELVEVGHAINRVKWGIWTFEEYRTMLEPLVVWQERLPDVRFGGPAVIDFEYAYIPTALDHLPPGMCFDVLTHHLYVDRRGAPERPQGRFALLEKLALARAIGRAHRRCGDGLIVTEFNWPLEGTGIHSPVGAPYVSPGVRQNDPSVSEEDAAAYMLRYILIAIASGLAERVFWWSLVAHGFGLIDDAGGSWRERPAYRALKVFLAHTRGWVFEDRNVAESGGGSIVCFRFRSKAVCGDGCMIAYTEHKEGVVFPVRAGARVQDAYGAIVEPDGDAIRLSGLPVYVWEP